MPCHWIQIKDPETGRVANVHLKMAAPRRRKCAFCDCRASLLCDFIGPRGVECSKPCCPQHRIIVGELDICAAHWAHAAVTTPEQGSLFL